MAPQMALMRIPRASKHSARKPPGAGRIQRENARGVPSVVTDGETGLLGPIKDPAAMAERLALLLQDPRLRTRMGKAGRARFERDFGLPAYHRRLAELFRGL